MLVYPLTAQLPANENGITWSGCSAMALVVLGLAWLAGLYLGTLLDPMLPLAALAAGLLAAWLWRRDRRVLLLSVAAISMLGGAVRSQTAASSSLTDVRRLADGSAMSLRGMVDDSPAHRGSGVEYRLTVDAVRREGERDWQAATGTILVRAPWLPEQQYGDYLSLYGRLEPPAGAGSPEYAAYLQRQGISGQVRYPAVKLLERGRGWPPFQALYETRARLAEALERSLPQPEAGLAEGILLGQRASLAPELREAFTRTNTSHVIAISGANMSLVAAFLLLVLRRAPSRLIAALGTIVGVVAYGAFVGFAPSVARAVVMGVAFVVGAALGRPRDATAALVLAAGVLTAWDPTTLFDLGFQLSFLATAGLVLFVAPVRRLLGRLPGRLADLLAVTIAAEIATTPLIAVTFGQLSLVGPVANLIVPSLLPFVMATSAPTALLGLFSPSLGQIVGLPAWLFLRLMVQTVESLAALPGAVLPLGQPAVAFLLAYYALLLVLALRFLPPTTPVHHAWRSLWRRVPALPTLAALAILAVLVWSAVLSLPDDNLRVSVFDVGQGDAILISTPQHKVLVDGGPNPDLLANALGRRLPFWDRTIDLVVLTHPNEDHLAGLNTVLERFRVKQVLTTGLPAKTASYERFAELVRTRGLAQHVAERGQEIALGANAALRVEHPVAGSVLDANDRSIVLRLSEGGFSMLLAGDLGPAGRDELMRSGEDLRSTILKVPHHGSADALDAELLGDVRPLTAIISVGRGNRYGHPAAATLDLLARSNVKVYRTDLNGTTEVIWRGDRYSISSDR